MLFIKFLILQSYWFLCVLQGQNIHSSVFFMLTAFILSAHYTFSSMEISRSKYIFLAFVFTFLGGIHDWGLVYLGLIDGHNYSWAYLSLWPVFLAYYHDFFKHFKGKLLLGFFLGLTGGLLTYWSAYKLGGFHVTRDDLPSYLIYCSVFWSLFFPLSIVLYHNETWWNQLLDFTVIHSFDSTGFKRHQKFFAKQAWEEGPLSSEQLSFKALVTGGTSGIGKAVSKYLVGLKIQTTVTGRDEIKGIKITSENENIHFYALDLADWESIDHFCKVCPVFHFLVLNAGGMPEKLVLNNQGIEYQCASQLIGHYRLMVGLKNNNKLASRARIVWVSSGGMYLKKLDLKNLFHPLEYEKVATYANVKRAQITWVEELSKMNEWKNDHIFTMHPGWVRTQGLLEALPSFVKMLKNRLRTEDQGADTIIWLLLTESELDKGALYFDRKKVNSYIFKSYNPNQIQRQELSKIMGSIIHLK